MSLGKIFLLLWKVEILFVLWFFLFRKEEIFYTSSKNACLIDIYFFRKQKIFLVSRKTNVWENCATDWQTSIDVLKDRLEVGLSRLKDKQTDHNHPRPDKI